MFSGQELIYSYPNGDVVVNVTAVYIVKKFRGELKLDREEVLALRFFDLNELPQDLSPPDKPVIENYIRNQLKKNY